VGTVVGSLLIAAFWGSIELVIGVPGKAVWAFVV
tara:strand:- start:694 stop:795 length:102 start_codon:yes stop_codon:yes gene_type:complete